MPNLNQFKTLTELSEIIQQLRGIEKKLFLARPVKRGEHPTLYANATDGKYRTVCGVRVCDYQLSTDEQWVEANEQMGLSFSGDWQHLKGVHKMVSRYADAPVDVFWVLGEANLPPGMAFKPDLAKKGHYFLAVVERMKLSTLITNLELIAHRMSKIEHVTLDE
ncbi:hypothetical protein [Chitinivorax sp. B]|uniref:hypothetical protein n=1 Tax=Chitinivorax sp. B TaxID=2502235 RepID=UPI0010F55B46|nr:hypothetical protein [Chitinivorax sp. B]